MEEATEREVRSSRAPSRRRGAKRDQTRVTREEVLTSEAPTVLRFEGYETIPVPEPAISSELACCRRAQWLTPEIIALHPTCRLGGLGPTCAGSASCFTPRTANNRAAHLDPERDWHEIFKRQIMRILASGLEVFAEEDQAVRGTGLALAPLSQRG